MKQYVMMVKTELTTVIMQQVFIIIMVYFNSRIIVIWFVFFLRCVVMSIESCVYK